MRLGSAIGSTMKKGASVIVSRDPSRTARMMKRALVAGLSSAGVSVCDLQGQPLPLLSYMTCRNGYAYAVHTQTSEDNFEMVDIKVFDCDGLALSRGDERKIETLLAREDPRRTSSREVGSISYYPRAVEVYTDDCLAHINVEVTKANRMRLVVDCGHGFTGSILPPLLAKMGAEVTSLNAIEQETKMPKTRRESERAREDLALIVKTIGANMGILIDPQGARMWVADDSGRVLTDMELAYMMALFGVRSKSSRGVTAPSYIPTVLTEALTSNGATVYRAKSHARELSDLASTSKSGIASDLAGGFVFPELHNGMDAIFAAAKLVEWVSTDSAPLSQLVQLVPEHHLLRDTMPCPWELKGQAMRELLGKLDQPGVDTFDGYRKAAGDGWYMVLPDAKHPSFTIYAEGPTRLDAEKILKEARRELAAQID